MSESTGAVTPRPGESLRDRKKRATRQLLSDTATELFLARGFGGVRVSEIAEACGVSEKTVFNYFPTKEALVMDRLEGTTDALLAALADPSLSPVEAALTVLAGELEAMTAQLGGEPDFRVTASRYSRFSELLRSTPSLRAHQSAVAEHLTAEAARILAERGGTDPADPEPRITAAALLALWPIQYRALERHLKTATTLDHLFETVTAEVRRAAAVLENGLA
ncbi:TetR/AcrR family transcriptional regulator [Actinospica durhamensis]|uniref:TetR/AcrR family transcriptional regulator n=1 Tax=Actinospica durhamensis TaxID=1508375 RepID=A0A941EZW6_9ACTN|nr:TetR/AcrR family transcriptional regulator [Actinospica durhamensis]MBR7837469.1 TetR/AcrR family transcriptional regulator [Actinospica durhamensis]